MMIWNNFLCLLLKTEQDKTGRKGAFTIMRANPVKSFLLSRLEKPDVFRKFVSSSVLPNKFLAPSLK
jgi:hypothetical protein